MPASYPRVAGSESRGTTQRRSNPVAIRRILAARLASAALVAGPLAFAVDKSVPVGDAPASVCLYGACQAQASIGWTEREMLDGVKRYTALDSDAGTT